MSTSTTAAAGTTTAYRLSTTGILRSEWHKLRTLRSTWITLFTAAALVIAVGITMGATYDGDDSEIDTVVFTLLGTQLSQICLAVLGILVTAGEYSTGMIRASLTAVPRRLPVLWSKAAIFTAVAFTVSWTTNVITFLTAQIWLTGTDKELSLTDDGVLGALTGSAAALTLLGLIALGLGALLRSVPGAIGAFVACVLILPEVLGMLPFGAVESALRHFPVQAAGSLGSLTRVENTIAPGTALVTLTLWAAAIITTASLLLKRRDV
ncbi:MULTISPECIES: ABC transporter permease [Streptomyces]|uniref:ABC transporter permease n=1 Tax=Streptomyces TaxID=1883 RepID=UPI001E2DA997|nr:MULTISPECIES: ABC transporter permease [Streptomyces]UFQ16639.1 ABC transporter permease [Streptomyces huasconensis]WCL86240.1 ABC transporter permease [Streptomyces sp. JCM 35825]